MSCNITQANLKQHNFNNNNNVNPKLHYAKLIPKSSVCKKNTSSSPNLVIKTSKRWILPPRPRPGRKTTCNTLNSSSKQPTNTIIIASDNAQINNNLHNTNKIKVNNNIQKKDSIQEQQVTDYPNAAEQRRNDLNYLAFLNFEENDQTERSTSNESSKTLTMDSVQTTRITAKNLPLLLILNINSKEGTPVTTAKTASPLDFTKQQSKKINNDLPVSPLNLSPSSTIVSTPNNINKQSQRRFSAPVKSFLEKNANIEDNQYFQKMYNEIDFNNDVEMDFNLFSNSSSTVAPESNGDEANLNLDNEDELFNNIWEFLPRYTNKEKKEITKKDNDTQQSNYVYVSPSLEELMEEQDNFMNLFEETPNINDNNINNNNNISINNNNNSVLNDFNDFTYNIKNFTSTNEFDDNDFDILKTESM